MSSGQTKVCIVRVVGVDKITKFMRYMNDVVEEIETGDGRLVFVSYTEGVNSPSKSSTFAALIFYNGKHVVEDRLT